MQTDAPLEADKRALCQALLREVGFGVVFLTTPDGARIAHAPLHLSDDGMVQFHLAKDDVLSPHLDGARALLLVNGPDAYVSPRWYEDRGQMPTWNYVALEMEGRVQCMAPEGLADLLGALGKRNETRLGGANPWTPGDLPADRWAEMFGAITGFELEVQQWRPTLKLSQNMSEEDRERIADALTEEGSGAIAQLMRVLGS